MDVAADLEQIVVFVDGAQRYASPGVRSKGLHDEEAIDNYDYAHPSA